MNQIKQEVKDKVIDYAINRKWNRSIIQSHTGISKQEFEAIMEDRFGLDWQSLYSHTLQGRSGYVGSSGRKIKVMNDIHRNYVDKNV